MYISCSTSSISPETPDILTDSDEDNNVIRLPSNYSVSSSYSISSRDYSISGHITRSLSFKRKVGSNEAISDCFLDETKVDHEPAVWQGFPNIPNANIIADRVLAKSTSFSPSLSSNPIHLFPLRSISFEKQNKLEDSSIIAEKELSESTQNYLSSDNDHIELLHKLSICQQVFLLRSEK